MEVTIPVLKLKEVPLKFEFSNVPAGYDPAELNASISPRPSASPVRRIRWTVSKA
ncbi:MAG: hypothetical protein ACLRZH_06315 [Ruthenibacterium lactatiformans]